MRAWLAAACLLLLGSPARAEQARAWLLAGLRFDDPSIGPAIDALGGMAPPVAELKACGIDARAGLSRVVLSLSHTRLEVQLFGKLQPAVGTCALEVLHRHRWLTGAKAEDRVVALDDRLRLTAAVNAPVPVDDGPLSIPADAGVAAVMRFGTRAATRQVELKLDAQGAARVTIGFASEPDARGFVGWFGEPFMHAAESAGLPAAAHVEQRGKQVSFPLPALGGWLQGMSFSLVVRRTVTEAFQIPSSSMEPTLRAGDHVFVAKGPRAGTAERGDVVVFHAKDGNDFVKRVIAVAGDRVAFEGEKLLINGRPMPRVRAGDYRYQAADGASTKLETAPRWRETIGKHVFEILGGATAGPSMAPLTVPAGSVFVVGDNRGNSYDSRFFGPVPLNDVVGPVEIIWFSSNDVGDVRWDRIGKTVE